MKSFANIQDNTIVIKDNIENLRQNIEEMKEVNSIIVDSIQRISEVSEEVSAHANSAAFCDRI